MFSDRGMWVVFKIGIFCRVIWGLEGKGFVLSDLVVEW